MQATQGFARCSASDVHRYVRHPGIENSTHMSFPFNRRVLPAALAVFVISSGMFWFASRNNGHETAQEHSAVYVALGASDAVGIGATRPETEGWVPVVHSGLPEKTQLVNLGISGATLRDVLAMEVPVVSGARPRLVTLWPGPNDIRAGVELLTFARQLDQILTAVREMSDPDIYVLNLPDLRYVPAFATADPAALDALVHEWNRAIVDVATLHGARVVDLYGASLELDDHPEYLSIDGFHPSSAGYRRIAEIVLVTISATSVSAS